jgi:hypothetical protein
MPQSSEPASIEFTSPTQLADAASAAIAASADGANFPLPTGNGAVKSSRHDEQRRRSRS